MRPHATRLLLPAHAAATLLAMAALALWPPSTGTMMLVPLPLGQAGAAAQGALGGGALLLGGGPVPGSLIVVGDRERIARAIGAWDVVIVAAPPAGCRANGPTRRTA